MMDIQKQLEHIVGAIAEGAGGYGINAFQCGEVLRTYDEAKTQLADALALMEKRVQGMVVEVVRCGECKHAKWGEPWPGGQGKMLSCNTPGAPFHNWGVPEDGFCHKGERRED